MTAEGAVFGEQVAPRRGCIGWQGGSGRFPQLGATKAYHKLLRMLQLEDGSKWPICCHFAGPLQRRKREEVGHRHQDSGFFPSARRLRCKHLSTGKRANGSDID
jgi:hypothetical protein